MINIPTKEIGNNRDNGGREFIVGADRVLYESFQIVVLKFPSRYNFAYAVCGYCYEDIILITRHEIIICLILNSQFHKYFQASNISSRQCLFKKDNFSLIN